MLDQLVLWERELFLTLNSPVLSPHLGSVDLDGSNRCPHCLAIL